MNCIAYPGVINTEKLLKYSREIFPDIPRIPSSNQCFFTPELRVREEYCGIFLHDSSM